MPQRNNTHHPLPASLLAQPLSKNPAARSPASALAQFSTACLTSSGLGAVSRAALQLPGATGRSGARALGARRKRRFIHHISLRAPVLFRMRTLQSKPLNRHHLSMPANSSDSLPKGHAGGWGGGGIGKTPILHGAPPTEAPLRRSSKGLQLSTIVE